jgi:hypothetical protein
MHKIYILVSVDYDYYRFQTNITAQLNNKEFPKSKFKKDLKTYRYAVNSKTQERLDGKKENHYWIQTIRVTATSTLDTFCISCV